MSAGSISKVILVGNVTRDPVAKTTTTGKKVVSFSVAVNRMKEGEADYHNCVAWEKLAETIEKYVVKGSKLYVEGRLQNRSYDDKEGVKKYVTEIIVTDMTMLGSKPTSTTAGEDATAPVAADTTTATTPAPAEDDIDF